MLRVRDLETTLTGRCCSVVRERSHPALGLHAKAGIETNMNRNVTGLQATMFVVARGETGEGKRGS